MRRSLMAVAVSAGLLGATPVNMGGWAVITVRDLPERLVAGVPAQLTFTMLQHGERPLTGRSPDVYIKGEGGSLLSSIRRPAAREVSPGVYRATVTATKPGAAEIVIDGNWHTATVTLLPIRVSAGSEPVAGLDSRERGRQLFVAKGCITCHARRDDPGLQRAPFVGGGPELTGRTFPTEWLAQKLTNPEVNRVRSSDWLVMPNLGLRPQEVSALVAYLNGPSAGPPLRGQRAAASPTTTIH